MDGTVGDLTVDSFTAYDPGWTAGESVVLRLWRDAENGSDTLSAPAWLNMVRFEWGTT